MLEQRIKSQYEKIFGKTPLMVFSPGRINLIGEHTDYNDGFVMPAAIDRYMYFATGRRNDDQIILHSYDLDDKYQTTVDNISPCEKGWANYLLGVLDEFRKAGTVPGGINLVFGGNIPFGTGISSSAALETGFAYAVNHLFGLQYDRLKLALMGQSSEHNYAGAHVGIMDQYATIYGKKDHAILLDCRKLEHVYEPTNLGNYTFVLLDTKVKHELSDSDYNSRPAECKQAVKALQQQYRADISALRDLSVSDMGSVENILSGALLKRARHVINENQRVHDAAEALKASDAQKFGEFMFRSHDSLRDDYQVSCRELDTLVEIARNHSAVKGSRMMGGGFGGCTINLVAEEGKNDFINTAKKEFKNQYGHDPEEITLHIVDGTGILS